MAVKQTHEFTLCDRDSVFWLDSRTIAHIVHIETEEYPYEKYGSKAPSLDRKDSFDSDAGYLQEAPVYFDGPPPDYGSMYTRVMEDRATGDMPTPMPVSLLKSDSDVWSLGTDYARLIPHEIYVNNIDASKIKRRIASARVVISPTLNHAGAKAAWLEIKGTKNSRIVVYGIVQDIGFTLIDDMDLPSASLVFSKVGNTSQRSR
ncbi:hypothetical protein BDN71DRAFT_1591857 [Pleurotus eryngii]|uniref:Uncharacterized protein n=1 Tax=Pleurotus eryngii TaxID=5323 RepID=A0A9P5ZQG2_PLEER|nr:hypothetical protein BDN71DRAFT_1591857 [Pleurotus eryngii]